MVVPLKYLSNFWRSLNMPLINCEVELILTWFKNFAIISKSTRDADYDEPIDRKIDNPENAIFQITDTKVALSEENDIKLLEELRKGLKKNYKMEQMQITNNCSASK